MFGWVTFIVLEGEVVEVEVVDGEGDVYVALGELEEAEVLVLIVLEPLELENEYGRKFPYASSIP